MRLTTRRLELIPGTFELIHADLRGQTHLTRAIGYVVPGQWPPPLTHFSVMLWFKQQLKQTPAWVGWFSWYWVLRDRSTLIGLGGFKGAPNSAGSVEVGYSVVPAFQRQGYATEAAPALIAWAFGHAEVNRVLAETLPDHIASIRVLEKAGFSRSGVNSSNGSLRFVLERSAWSRTGSAGPGSD